MKVGGKKEGEFENEKNTKDLKENENIDIHNDDNEIKDGKENSTTINDDIINISRINNEIKDLNLVNIHDIVNIEKDADQIKNNAKKNEEEIKDWWNYSNHDISKIIDGLLYGVKFKIKIPKEKIENAINKLMEYQPLVITGQMHNDKDTTMYKYIRNDELKKELSDWKSNNLIIPISTFFNAIARVLLLRDNGFDKYGVGADQLVKIIEKYFKKQGRTISQKEYEKRKKKLEEIKKQIKVVLDKNFVGDHALIVERYYENDWVYFGNLPGMKAIFNLNRDFLKK